MAAHPAAEAITADHIAQHILFEGFKSTVFIPPPNSKEHRQSAKKHPHS
jgi:hypothetical protein